LRRTSPTRSAAWTLDPFVALSRVETEHFWFVVRITAAGVFDFTGAFDVIEHVADDEGVLRGIYAATKAGGGTIVAVPQHPWM
jgi:hypothetical protein